MLWACIFVPTIGMTANILPHKGIINSDVLNSCEFNELLAGRIWRVLHERVESVTKSLQALLCRLIICLMTLSRLKSNSSMGPPDLRFVQKYHYATGQNKRSIQFH